MTALGKTVQGLRTFASDIAQGFFEITHNGFALVAAAFKPLSAVASVVVAPDTSTIAFGATTSLTATLARSRSILRMNFKKPYRKGVCSLL